LTGIRIIGGQWKRTPIPVLDLPGLRPTPDRVRETLFNWIGPSIQGMNCLDAFAGTGALGFEAASRGAASVLMFETNAKAIANLQALKAKLKAEQIEVRMVDALAQLKLLAQRRAVGFDLVMCDPPFAQGLMERLPGLVAPLLKVGGWFYAETDAPFELPPVGFELYRQDKAGQVHYHLFSKAYLPESE
jgi:16S rRNA (guanine966-N2)-methyltransferase